MCHFFSLIWGNQYWRLRFYCFKGSYCFTLKTSLLELHFCLAKVFFWSKQKVCRKKRCIFIYLDMGIVSMGLSCLCTDFSRERLYVLGWSISLLNESSISAEVGYRPGCLYLVTNTAFLGQGKFNQMKFSCYD